MNSNFWQQTVSANAPSIAGTPYVSPIEKQAIPIGGHSGHDRLSRYLTSFAAGSAVLALTPTIIHKIADKTGNGKVSNLMSQLSGGCCPIIKKQAEKQGTAWVKDAYGEPAAGIAGALSVKLGPIPRKVEEFLHIDKTVENALDKIPGIWGQTLKRDEVKLALMGGGITLVSHTAGNMVGKINRRLGKFTQSAMQIFGLTCMLPAVLPGVGHFILTGSALIGLDKVDLETKEAHGPGVAIAALLGKSPGECWLEEGKAMSGAVGGGVMAICCGLPAIIGAIPAVIGRLTGERTQNHEGQAR